MEFTAPLDVTCLQICSIPYSESIYAASRIQFLAPFKMKTYLSAPSAHGPRCLKCDTVEHPAHCGTVTECAAGQVVILIFATCISFGSKMGFLILFSLKTID